MEEYKIDVRQRLQEYNKNAAYKKLRDHYSSKTIFEIMGKSRNETAHSSFLAWLLEGKDIPSSGNDCPLLGLLDIIIRRAGEQKTFNGDDRFNLISKAVLSRSIEFVNIKAKTEQSVLELAKASIKSRGEKTIDNNIYGIGNGDEKIKDIEELISPKGKRGKKDSLDIYITCDVKSKYFDKINRLEFLIENKVVSSEGRRKSDGNEYEKKSQTERYYWACKKDNETVMQFFLYLTASASSDLELNEELNKKESNAWCKDKEHYICINYQDIYDDILEPLIASERLSDKTELIIKEYVRSLSLPVMSSDIDEEKDDKQDSRITIMATSKNERKSLLEFWNDNQDLLYPAMEVVEEKDNLQPHKWTHCVYKGDCYDKIGTIRLVYNLFKKECEEKGEDYFRKMYLKKEFNKLHPSRREGHLDIFDNSGNFVESNIEKVVVKIRKMAQQRSTKLTGFKCDMKGQDYIQEAFSYFSEKYQDPIPSLRQLILDTFNQYTYKTNQSAVAFNIIENDGSIKKKVGNEKIENIYNAIRNNQIQELENLTNDIKEISYESNEHTRDLLYSFWEVNQDLVMAALWVLSDSDCISQEDKGNVAKVYSKMAKRGRMRYVLKKKDKVLGQNYSMLGVVRRLMQEQIFTSGQGQKDASAINKFLSMATGQKNIVKRKTGTKEIPKYYEVLRKYNNDTSTFYYNIQGWTKDGLFGKLKDYCDGKKCDYIIEEMDENVYDL